MITLKVLNLQRDEVILDTYSDMASRYVADIRNEELRQVEVHQSVTGVHIPADNGRAIVVGDDTLIEMVDLNSRILFWRGSLQIVGPGLYEYAKLRYDCGWRGFWTATLSSLKRLSRHHLQLVNPVKAARPVRPAPPGLLAPLRPAVGHVGASVTARLCRGPTAPRSLRPGVFTGRVRPLGSCVRSSPSAASSWSWVRSRASPR